ncbi:MAG: hypothetical protein JMN26_15640, partial [gamma proteobacterium endosymbiont of Lamellibrachia anaximandri]|nr:hypothetical protein [gamma proteobacterium endosymbiont of Lamellibrachia anaximandri]
MFTNGKLTPLQTGNALSVLGRFCRVLLLLFLAQHFIAGHAYSREIERQQNILIIKSGQVSLRPRERFWDIPVPKIDSAFDSLFVPRPSRSLA